MKRAGKKKRVRYEIARIQFEDIKEYKCNKKTAKKENGRR